MHPNFLNKTCGNKSIGNERASLR